MTTTSANGIQEQKSALRNRSPSAQTVSVLAILETIVAVLIYAGIAAKFGTLHLTISAWIMPLLLLRTDRSTRRGLDYAKHRSAIGKKWIDYMRSSGSLRLAMLTVIALPILGGIKALLIRITATLVSSLLHPMESLRAIPRNWWRHVAFIDSTTEPEAVPGASELPFNFFLPYSVTREFANWEDTDQAALGCFFLPPYFVLVWLPVLLFRLAVKGTALVYSPLIYVVYSSFSNTPVEQLRGIKDLALNRCMRVYAGFTLLFFAAKIYLFVGWSELSKTWNRLPAVSLINEFVVPRELPPWQIASISSAVITWCVFFGADYSLARQSSTKVIPNWTVQLIQTMCLLRGMLSIYSVICILYIVASLVPRIDWPPLGSKLVPWT